MKIKLLIICFCIFNVVQAADVFTEYAEYELGICREMDYTTIDDQLLARQIALHKAQNKCTTIGLKAKNISAFKYKSFCKDGSIDRNNFHLYIAASASFECFKPIPPGRNCSYGQCDPYRNDY